MYRGEVLRERVSVIVVFPLLRNLEISTQKSNAKSTEISKYKVQFLTCNSEQKGQEGSLLNAYISLKFPTNYIVETSGSVLQN